MSASHLQAVVQNQICGYQLLARSRNSTPVNHRLQAASETLRSNEILISAWRIVVSWRSTKPFAVDGLLRELLKLF